MITIDAGMTALELHAILTMVRVLLAKKPGMRLSPSLRRQAKSIERKVVKALRAYGDDVD